MNTKISKAIDYVTNCDTLTKGEKESLLGILGKNKPWYIVILEVLKYIGAVAGFMLAGFGASACSSFLNL